MKKKRRVFLVAGARPNFMKIAPIYHEMKSHSDNFEPIVVHTGQHYDVNMSDMFFRDLELPAPDVYLGVGSGSHAEQTAGIMLAFEKVCIAKTPDLVIVVGDVNSTMACAITAVKLNIPVAHVEAGLRSGDRSMPEEINRLITDSISQLLFTPSKDADENLLKEGCASGRIYRVGNIMIDSLEFIRPKVKYANTCERLGINPKTYGLVTLHRPSNVDIKETIEQIISIFRNVSKSIRIIFPVHPRTRKNLETFGLLSVLDENSNITLLDPLGYIDFMNLMMNAKFVITDSGGIQEETTYLGIPCLTLRPNTERLITITEGTNELVSLDDLESRIMDAYNGRWKKGRIPELWDGMTAPRIVNIIRFFEKMF
jgi:UDP-N-acetylglucosamine 2-epimerase (non-hydrolysing)